MKNNRRKWSFDATESEAKKYQFRRDFQKGSPGAYDAAFRKGWLELICGHMPKRKSQNGRVPPNKRWGKKNVEVAAKGFRSRKEFKLGASGAYAAARSNGWMDDVCAHMKPVNRWTTDRLKKEAAKYSSRKQFQLSSPSAYTMTIRRGLADQVMGQIKPLRKSWPIEDIKAAASTYKTRSAFMKNERGAYNAAKRLGVLDFVCSHMRRVGHHYLRCVYAIEFPATKEVYVGLTFNPDKRFRSHKSNGLLKDKLAAERHTFKIVVGYQDKENAAISEGLELESYLRRGWSALNRTATGSLGGGKEKWTLEAVVTEAKKYETRGAFQDGSVSAYNKARVRGWLNDVCSHMSPPKCGPKHRPPDSYICNF